MEVVFWLWRGARPAKSGSHFEVVQSQLETVLFDLHSTEWSKIILAYEPVWAIGTGRPFQEQAKKRIAFISRGLIKTKYDQVTKMFLFFMEEV